MLWTWSEHEGRGPYNRARGPDKSNSSSLISKGNVKHLLLRKTDVLKTCRRSKFLGKQIWRNALALKSKKVQGIFGETFTLALFSCLSSTKPCLKFLLICFAQEIKDLGRLSSLGNEVDFREIMNISPNILAKT